MPLILTRYISSPTSTAARSGAAGTHCTSIIRASTRGLLEVPLHMARAPADVERCSRAPGGSLGMFLRRRLSQLEAAEGRASASLNKVYHSGARECQALVLRRSVRPGRCFLCGGSHDARRIFMFMRMMCVWNRAMVLVVGQVGMIICETSG